MSRNLKIFAVADKINGNGLMMSGTAYTAGAFIRDSLPYFKHRGFDFMNEGLLYCIGEFDENTFTIVDTKKELLSWDEYKRPEIPVTHDDVKIDN